MRGLAQMELVFVIGFLAAISLVSVTVVTSFDRYVEVYERAEVDVVQAKKELLRPPLFRARPAPVVAPAEEADRETLMAAHLRVHQQVGERQWEATVKPRFLRSLILETIRDSGNPLPGLRDVVEWSRTHPAKSVDLLEKSR